MIKKGEYKGKAVITLLRAEDDRFPFSFGASKAKLIVENYEEIKKFVEETNAAEQVKKDLTAATK